MSHLLWCFGMLFVIIGMVKVAVVIHTIHKGRKNDSI